MLFGPQKRWRPDAEWPWPKAHGKLQIPAFDFKSQSLCTQKHCGFEHPYSRGTPTTLLQPTGNLHTQKGNASAWSSRQNELFDYLILFDTIIWYYLYLFVSFCIYLYSTWRHLIWDFQWLVLNDPLGGVAQHGFGIGLIQVVEDPGILASCIWVAHPAPAVISW